MSNLIRQARDTRGWTSARLNHELRSAANELGITTASQASLRVMISRWENDEQTPDGTYRLLLQKAFNLPGEALGFVDESDGEDAARPLVALVQRGSRRIEVTDSVLGYFQAQRVEHARMDMIAGPGLVVDTVSAQMAQLRLMAGHGPVEVVELAARFVELAGWLHQDSGDPHEALRLTGESVDLAESAGNVPLTAYNMMRKGNILSSLAEHRRAGLAARKAVEIAERNAPDLLPVCLRQVALVDAYLGHEMTSRAALDRALELTSVAIADANDLSGYCTTSYVEMEGALCALVLGSPASAVEACSRALASWPAGLIRDEGLCLTRLAAAQLDLHNVDEACGAALMAIERVHAAPSARTLHMLRVISRRVSPFSQSRSVRQLRQALANVA